MLMFHLADINVNSHGNDSDALSFMFDLPVSSPTTPTLFIPEKGI